MGRLKQLAGRLGGAPSRIRSMPKLAERFYQSAEWLAYRAEHKAWTIRQKGGLWCARCGSTFRLILDHKLERKDGGEDFPPLDGCEWLCGGCHNAKTAVAKATRATQG